MTLRDRLMSSAVFAPEGGSAAPTDGGTQQQSQPDAPPAWATALNENITGLSGTMRELLQVAKTPQPTPALDADDEPEPSAEDLETMSRAQFGEHIVNSVLKAVNSKVVEPLNAQIANITAQTTRSDIQGAVKELTAKHKDFMDWKDEMISLATEHKGMAPHRLYVLARAENPEKAKKLDEKYNPPTGPANGGRVRLTGFGGLTPSQSGTGSRNRAMSPKDAANTAWAETVAALGGEPLFDEE